MTQEAKTLCLQFIQYQGTKRPSGWADLRNWFPNEQFIFLQCLFDNSDRLVYDTMKLINESYNFDNDGNYEILWRWYRIAPYVR